MKAFLLLVLFAMSAPAIAHHPSPVPQPPAAVSSPAIFVPTPAAPVPQAQAPDQQAHEVRFACMVAPVLVALAHTNPFGVIVGAIYAIGSYLEPPGDTGHEYAGAAFGCFSALM